MPASTVCCKCCCYLTDGSMCLAHTLKTGHVSFTSPSLPQDDTYTESYISTIGVDFVSGVELSVLE
jgi:hypothetical protein